MSNLTKVHTWSFASGLDGYVSNQDVEIVDVCDAVRVTSKQSISTPGIKRNLSVQANTDYILSVKGYSNRVNAFIWVMNKHTSQRLIPCYYYLGCQPCWKSYKFNISLIKKTLMAKLTEPRVLYARTVVRILLSKEF